MGNPFIFISLFLRAVVVVGWAVLVQVAAAVLGEEGVEGARAVLAALVGAELAEKRYMMIVSIDERRGGGKHPFLI